MAERRRIPIRGIDDRSPVERVTQAHATGARRIKPLIEYQTRPLDFLTNVLKIPRHTLVWSESPGYADHSWDGTPDPLVRVCEGLAGRIPGKRHVAIEAATGTQKTYTASGLALWFLASFEDALVVTTAPIEKQLRQNLWKEVGAHLAQFRREFPKAMATDLKLRMRPAVADAFADSSGSTMRQEKWSMIGWCAGVDAGADSAVRSQGFHAEHMLIIVEEFPGMDPATVTALKNTCTAPHNIILGMGNPDNQLDPLHKFAQSVDVEAVRISAYDHPNVVCDDPNLVPGATSRDFIASNLADYGEDGPLYLSRVRGMSPREAYNALFKLAWLEEAARKWETPAIRAAMEEGPKALGVDPAQTLNGDRMALAPWKGAVLQTLEKAPMQDALQFGIYVHTRMKLEGIEAKYVGVDDVGIGSNVANYLRAVLPPTQFVTLIHGGADDARNGVMKTATVVPVVGGREYQADAVRFDNMRAQVYWQLAQDLAHGLVALPRHAGLWQELMAVTYSTDNGVVLLEKKKSIIKKLGRSPDYADCSCYGNWVRPRSERAPRRSDNEAKTDGRARPRETDPVGRLIINHIGSATLGDAFDMAASFGRAYAPSQPHRPGSRYSVPRRGR